MKPRTIVERLKPIAERVVDVREWRLGDDPHGAAPVLREVEDLLAELAVEITEEELGMTPLDPHAPERIHISEMHGWFVVTDLMTGTVVGIHTTREEAEQRADTIRGDSREPTP
jgi:hypothetical protein